MIGVAKQIDPSESRQTQLNKGVAELAILLLLREKSHYGLELLERMNSEVGLEIADGTIYPLLHRLERGGRILAQWQTDTPNGRPRKYYALTADGETHCANLLDAWRRLSRGVSRLSNGEKSNE